MRSHRTLTASIAVAAALGAVFLVSPAPAALATDADAMGDWFTNDALTARSLTVDSLEGTSRSRTVTLNANAAVDAVVSAESLAAAEAGERVVVPKLGDLSLTLFDDQQLTIDVTEVAVTLDAEGVDVKPTIEVIGSHDEDGGTEATAAFTFVPDESGNYSLYGGIDRGDEPRVTIEQQTTGVARLDEVDVTQIEGPEEPSDAAVAEGPVSSTPATEPSPEPAPMAVSDMPRVELVVGYVSSLGSKAVSQIKQRVTETNTALATSKVNLRLYVTSIVPVNYTQDLTDMQTDLTRFRDGVGPLALVKNQRDALGADMAALIVPKSTPTECGRAWVPHVSGAPESAFSVTAFDAARCHAFSFAHELGHNLGANHNREDTKIIDTPYSFSYGHRVPGKASDIMAYPCKTSACPRKLQYSNPAVDFIGYPGVKSGTATANNARSMSGLAPTISKYRAQTKYARVSGTDRYATAVAISKHGYPDATKVSTLVVATGTEFPDALSAAPLAAKVGGPLLLSSPTALPASTKTEIQRLKPSKILIAGGTGAVSAEVETTLKGLVTTGGTVTRLSGTDRYATSLAIAKYGFPTISSVFVATGTDYPDALSAGAAAGKLGAPVVLVPGTASTVPTTTSSYLTGAGVKTAYIAGGTAIVSSSIQSSLSTGRTVKRYAGTDRYNTSVLIANDHHTVGGRMYLASGLDFPDALAGAAIAGRNKAPLVLSGKVCVLGSITAVQATIRPTAVYLLGGTALLADSIRQGQTC